MKFVVALCVLLIFAACDDPVADFLTECEGPYPDQASSPYILPYTTGATFVVGLANCVGGHGKGTREQYAYDFLMPIGTNIVAVRDGTVLQVQDNFQDGTQVPGQENFIHVRHGDGTVAVYKRLSKDGALAGQNDPVQQGQVIALSGNSGSGSDPHLHFHVQACSDCVSIPVTFKNTRAHPNGLVQGESYTAQ